MTITSTTVSSGGVSNDSPINLTFTPSEETTDFTESDITVTNGTLSNFTTPVSGSFTHTINFSQYAIEEGGVESTYNTHNLSAIYSGDWIFEDISTVDTGGLTAWGGRIEVISQSDTNWTIVRLSHVDGINFSLNNFVYSPEGAHTYKLVSDTGYEYQVSTDDSEFGMGSSVNQNILNSHFSGISYVDFYSQAITYLMFGEFEITETKWKLDDIQLSYSVSDNEYTATLTPTTEGVYTVNVAADSFTDPAGFSNIAATPFTWTYDSTPPTMEITSTTVTSGTASTDSTIDLIFTSSEATTDFTESDISVTNGSLSNFTTNDGFIISRIDHNDTNPNYSSPVTDNTFTIWDSAPDDGTLSVSFTNENTFTLGGEQYTGITLQSNGWLQFGATNNWYGNLELLQNTPSIAIPWDDYNTVGNSDLGIGYKYSADDTQFIVSYDTHEYGNTTDVQIMVTLNLDSHSEPGTIRIDYGKLENNAGLVGVSYGLGSSESTLIEVDYLTITEPEFVAYPNIPYKNYGTDIQNFEYKTLIFSKVPEGYRATLTPSGEGECTVNVAGDTFTDLAGNGNTATTPFTWTYLTVSINYVKLSMTESSTYHAAHPAYGNSVVNSNFIILFDLKIFINDVDVATSASLSRSSALNGSLEATNITAVSYTHLTLPTKRIV